MVNNLNKSDIVDFSHPDSSTDAILFLFDYTFLYI